MAKDAVSVAGDQVDIRRNRAVIRRGPSRSRSDDELIIFVLRHLMQPGGKVREHRHHRLDLSASGTGQEGYKRLVRQPVPGQERLPRLLQSRRAVHRVNQRVAFVDEIDALPLEIVDLERENDEEPVDIGLQLLDSAFARGPHLRGDVPEDLETGLVGELGDPEVESGIVDEDHDVRLPGQDVLLAGAHAPEQLPRLDEHLPDAHHGPFPIVPHEADPLLMLLEHRVHQPAAPEADVRLGIARIQAAHQVGTVQVAGRLAGYQVEFHNSVPWRSRSRFSSSKSVRSMVLGTMVIQLDSLSTWSASMSPSSSSTKSPIII